MGLGLYNGAPSIAFVVELLYGVLCWWIYRGSRTLLAVLVASNLANISFFFARIPGPEEYPGGAIFLRGQPPHTLWGEVALAGKNPSVFVSDVRVEIHDGRRRQGITPSFSRLDSRLLKCARLTAMQPFGRCHFFEQIP